MSSCCCLLLLLALALALVQSSVVAEQRTLSPGKAAPKGLIPRQADHPDPLEPAGSGCPS